MTTYQALYSQLPSVDRLLQDASFSPLLHDFGHTQVLNALRKLLSQARETIRIEGQLPAWYPHWAEQVKQRLEAGPHSALQPVFNLTGTVLHTNLGRALLAEAAVQAVAKVMRSPVTLEYELNQATRGHRDRAVAALLCQLTGAEDACVVNNNAAAVLLMLAACAQGKQVIVSRGELVEIGGAFRIPDVMCQAGCQLVEVGTTNRTHLKDYRQAVGDNTALIMKVHTSNYQITGFTQTINEAELVTVGDEFSIPVAADLGSGSLIDLAQWGLPAEPMPQQLIAAGVSLVSFSGDKLLGGPQAGIIIGKKSLIARIQQHPLKRALRADKMTLAALEATLQLYQHPEILSERLPTLRVLTRTLHALNAQAQRLYEVFNLQYGKHFRVQIEPCLSQIGSGSLPANHLPSTAITLTTKDGRGATLEALAQSFRQYPIPIIGRINDGRLWLDLRCLDDEAGFIENLRR